jgi:hypothetical protein
MGVHRERRVEHEQKIARLHAERAPVEAGILREQSAEADADREIAKLAIKAAHGDRTALKQQRELRVLKDEHHLQAENLDSLASPIRKAIAMAEAQLPHFLTAEAHEHLAELMRKLSVMGTELSTIVRPVAKAFGEYRAEINAVTAECLPRIARGDPRRVQYLENRFRTMLARGIRAQLSFDFRSEGLDIIDVGQFDGKDFESVCEPLFRAMISALEVDLHANGVPTPGRANFRCATNVSGLFGLFLRQGEIVSLPVGNEDVQKMIAMGALEQIGEESE